MKATDIAKILGTTRQNVYGTNRQRWTIGDILKHTHEMKAKADAIEARATDYMLALQAVTPE